MSDAYTIHVCTLSKLNDMDEGRGVRWRWYKSYPRIWLPGSAGCQPTPASGAWTVVRENSTVTIPVRLMPRRDIAWHQPPTICCELASLTIANTPAWGSGEG